MEISRWLMVLNSESWPQPRGRIIFWHRKLGVCGWAGGYETHVVNAFIYAVVLQRGQCVWQPPGCLRARSCSLQQFYTQKLFENYNHTISFLYSIPSSMLFDIIWDFNNADDNFISWPSPLCSGVGSVMVRHCRSILIYNYGWLVSLTTEMW